MKGKSANKLFSIILLNYNAIDEFLSCSINSIVNQKYSNIELIIADDGSNDF